MPGRNSNSKVNETQCSGFYLPKQQSIVSTRGRIRDYTNWWKKNKAEDWNYLYHGRGWIRKGKREILIFSLNKYENSICLDMWPSEWSWYTRNDFHIKEIQTKATNKRLTIIKRLLKKTTSSTFPNLLWRDYVLGLL